MSISVETLALAKKNTKQAVEEAVTSVYKYRGSVETLNDLPTSGQKVGDVYNVEKEAGRNYAWDGSNWDALGIAENLGDIEFTGADSEIKTINQNFDDSDKVDEKVQVAKDAAQAAYDQANAAYNRASSAYSRSNVAYSQANDAYNAANAAANNANNAYNAANVANNSLNDLGNIEFVSPSVTTTVTKDLTNDKISTYGIPIRAREVKDGKITIKVTNNQDMPTVQYPGSFIGGYGPTPEQPTGGPGGSYTPSISSSVDEYIYTVSNDVIQNDYYIFIKNNLTNMGSPTSFYFQGTLSYETEILITHTINNDYYDKDDVDNLVSNISNELSNTSNTLSNNINSVSNNAANAYNAATNGNTLLTNIKNSGDYPSMLALWNNSNWVSTAWSSANFKSNAENAISNGSYGFMNAFVNNTNFTYWMQRSNNIGNALGNNDSLAYYLPYNENFRTTAASSLGSALPNNSSFQYELANNTNLAQTVWNSGPCTAFKYSAANALGSDPTFANALCYSPYFVETACNSLGSNLPMNSTFQNTMNNYYYDKNATNSLANDTLNAAKAYTDSKFDISLKKEVVQALPAEGEEDVLYLVPKTDAETENIYDEYIWTNNEWELIGSTEVDLSNYYTKTESDNRYNPKLTVGNGIDITNNVVSVDNGTHLGFDNNGKLTVSTRTLGTSYLRSVLANTSYASSYNPLATKEYVDNLISTSLKRLVVEQLPQNPNTYTIYMILRSAPTTNNIYDEYMYINNAWELIGSTAIDLSGYYTSNEVDNIASNLNNGIADASNASSNAQNSADEALNKATNASNLAQAAYDAANAAAPAAWELVSTVTTNQETNSVILPIDKNYNEYFITFNYPIKKDGTNFAASMTGTNGVLSLSIGGESVTGGKTDVYEKMTGIYTVENIVDNMYHATCYYNNIQGVENSYAESFVTINDATNGGAKLTMSYDAMANIASNVAIAVYGKGGKELNIDVVNSNNNE